MEPVALSVTARTEDRMNSLLAAATLAGPEQAPVETARYVVGEAVWAPSVHNTQPWWFSAGSGGLSLYADLAQPLLVARLNWEPGPAATG